MNRREFLRWLGLSSLAISGGFWWKALESHPTYSFYLMTNQPGRDIQSILRLFPDLDKKSLTIWRFPFSGQGQDVTVQFNGQIIEPVASTHFPKAFRQWVAHLRRRSAAANWIVGIEPWGLLPSGQIVIVSNGQVFERLPIHKNYRHIKVPGPMGATILQIENGLVRVKEASCKHKICQHLQGTSRIICAPNRLLVVGANQHLHAII